MPTDQTLKLDHSTQRIEATDTNLSGSTFTDVNLTDAAFTDVNLSNTTISDANLSGLQIRNANLRNASIADSLTDGMTINGIPVTDLLAAYRASAQKADR